MSDRNENGNETPNGGSPNGGGRRRNIQSRSRGEGGRRARAATVPAQVRTRRSRYMIASRQAPGVQPLSTGDMVSLLQHMPDIEVVKQIDPPRVLGLQAFGVATPGVLVADMEEPRAELLSVSGRGQVMVERDEFLNYVLEPGLLAPRIPNPGVFMASATGFSATFEVRGPDGPLAGAEVHLFGALFPTKGITGGDGRVTLEIAGEAPQSMRALYVKPRADHWDFWLPDPDVSTASTNQVTLRPLLIQEATKGRPFGWGQKAMGLDQLPQAFDGRGVKVAVLDSGAAQLTHRNLGMLGPGISLISEDMDAWTEDVIGHGSHCAGVIGATLGEEGGILGCAPAAEIHVCRVFPGGRFSDLIGAIDYCMENAIDIASMSLGGGSGSQIVADRIAQARNLGTACIVAAGNSASQVQFPAFLPTTLAVSAIGRFGEYPEDSFHAEQVLDGFQGSDGFFPAAFSCFGPEIDVCGPGVAVTSAVPDDGFASWDGTSMATPHVAGLAALMLAHHAELKGTFPNSARVDRLFDLIRASCIPLPFGAERVGRGLPWAPRALGLEEAGGSAPAASVPPQSFEALLRLIRLLQNGAMPS
jgi:hypothetical protein